MKIAVIGSGLAGLHAAWLLADPAHYASPGDAPEEVHLFERNGSVGMDAASVDVAKDVRVDIPMRGFYRGYYPRLTRLYDLLGIDYERRNHTICFARAASSSDSSVRMNGHLHTRKETPNPNDPPVYPLFSYHNLSLGLAEVPFPNLQFGIVRPLALGVEWLRFLHASHTYVAARAAGRSTAEIDKMTLGEYLTKRGYSHEFRVDCLLPFMAGICTCYYEDMEAYPAGTVLEFCGSGMVFEGASVVTQGVRQVCEVLSAKVHKIHLNAPVAAVYNEQVDGRTLIAVETADGTKRHFDHVVIASQANQALQMLRDATPEEREALGAFKYVRSEVVLHSDPRVMPVSERDWRGINFATIHRPSELVWSATNYMNHILPALSAQPTPIFQTWNPPYVLDPAKIISVSVFERPVVSLSTEANLERLWSIQGKRNIWFVGAYAGSGVPLLEGCVYSGMRIAQAIGVREDRVYIKPNKEVATWRNSIIVRIFAVLLNLLAWLLGWAL